MAHARPSALEQIMTQSDQQLPSLPTSQSHSHAQEVKSRGVDSAASERIDAHERGDRDNIAYGENAKDADGAGLGKWRTAASRFAARLLAQPY